jgi:hexosaminidase
MIIPKPVEMEAREGSFAINRDTMVVCDSPERRVEEAASYLANVLETPMGFRLKVGKGEPAGRNNAIVLNLTRPGPETPAGGYTLEVTPRRVTVCAAEGNGVFHGIQTLRQLLPVEAFSPYLVTRTSWTMPAVAIRDYPRYAWRGLMLDVCRHFTSKECVFRFLDLMALHKLNVFHIHLTDDQGWRIEIKKYPGLTETGALRKSSPVLGDRARNDGIPYGPWFYTQEDIREIVEYARQRAITVVPEIEMPGHAKAALSAYPELSCTGGPFEVRTTWGIDPDVYCAGKESVFGFLEEVLDEVLYLFPGPFVHIGGDECPKTRWQACPDCQRRIGEEGLKDEYALQSYFVRRIARYLQGKGRRLIGWDETLEGGLAENAAVMSWRGIEGGQQAAREGHDVVMTPVSHCYFDYYQAADPAGEPEAFGEHLPLEKVYGYDPSDVDLTKEERLHIMGVQGNIWTEYIPSYRQVEYMTYPRAAALAESAWTPLEKKDYEDFLSRLRAHSRRLDLLAVNYRPD